MIQIIKLHTLPEMLTDKGINVNDVTITDDAARALIKLLGDELKDGGIRPLERAINDIVSKINLLRTLYNAEDNSIPLTFKLSDFKGFPYIITSDSIHSLLKKPTETNSLSMYI
jgi:ATP-dependent Lon protease